MLCCSSMKVAVIGGGVLGMNMALKLHELEASVTLFNKSKRLGGKLARISELDADYLIASGRAFDFCKKELSALSEQLNQKIKIKNVEVKRVNKRFLSRDQNIENRSRLADLFRVVYKIDPTEMVESQKIENPELYKNFDLEMLKSLSEEMESFEDFDLVVEAAGNGETPFLMGPGGSPALNEMALSKGESFLYGWEAASFLQNPNSKNIIISGHEEAAALAVLSLKEWLSEKGNSLTVISDGTKPFENLNPYIKEKFDAFMKTQEARFLKDMESFREKTFEWRELEDYEKAKIVMPVEPGPPFDILVNSSITAIDRLLDKEGYFLTIETPDYIGESKLSVIKADKVLVLKGHLREVTLSENLQSNYNLKRDKAADNQGIHPEPGFYTLGGNGLEAGLKQIGPIIKNMLSFFSRIEN